MRLARLGRPRRPWTLRGRLIAALLLLLAAVCSVIGFISVNTLHNQVQSQVDRQLVAAVDRQQRPDDGRHHSGSEGPDDGEGLPLTLPGNATGTLFATRADNVIQSAGIVQGSTGADVPAKDEGALLTVPADSNPHTVTLGDLGEYRVIATPAPDGDAAIITGLPLSDANSTISNVTVAIVAVSAAGLALAAIAGTVIVRLALRPLRRVTETATRVSKLPLDRGEVALAERVPDADTDTRTEVGQVGTALNSMLGHVATALKARQASEMRVRQFVADASHELRTPLAAIRGYAEITRRTGEDIPEDITYAMNRVESEAKRMTGLVEDLLLLARLDAGRPIDREAVDLTALVIDAVSDAHAAGPEHPVTLTLPDEPIEVVGDSARLHQVLTNLLTNARVHTAPGTAVSVALRTGPSPTQEVVIEVADEGPGIPPELLPHIFERFARADSSRSRTAGSTGLGLAIVSAVVAAHGGSVNVHSRPGSTVFAVRLPATPSTGTPRHGANSALSAATQPAARPPVTSQA